MDFRLQPHDRNLLLCLKAADALSLESAVGTFSGADWDGVVQRASDHRVSPLLFRGVQTLEPAKRVPGPAYQMLRRTCLRIAGRNTRRFYELSLVLRDLKGAGIPFIVLKGAHLAETVYGDTALRDMDDVDLLVRREDLARCHDRLKDMGVLDSPKGLTIDLHWEVETNVLPLRIRMKDLWQRAVPARIAGVDVLGLCPADLVLHLCVHLANHHLFRVPGLRTLFDIRECIGHFGDALDWKLLARVAENWRAGNAVFLSLTAAGELAGANIPSAVLQGLKPEAFDEQTKVWAYHQLFHGRDDDRELSPNFCLLLEPGPMFEKMRRLLALAFPSREIVSHRFAVRYGSGGNYLHYLVRLKEFFPRYARVMWGLIRRDEKVEEWVEDQRRLTAVRKWLAAK